MLLPSLLKRDFPNHIALMTAAYAITMGCTAALGSVVVVPLAHFIGGWELALGSLIVLPVIALLFWSTQIGAGTRLRESVVKVLNGSAIWKSAIAWQVTIFLGLNSFVYYAAVGWLPTILSDAGYTASKAGSLHGLLQLSTAFPAPFLVPLVARMKDQKMIATAVSLAAAVGAAGLAVAPSFAPVWIVLFGAGTGAAVILALSFLSLRAASARQAIALSGMAQCLGYLLAAAGPSLLGILHDASSGWKIPLLVCALLCVFTGRFWLQGRA